MAAAKFEKTTHIRISKTIKKQIQQIVADSRQSECGWLELAAQEKMERDHPGRFDKKVKRK